MWWAPPEPGTCLTPDEAKLARLINEYRSANGRSYVPLSRSLSEVAQRHVQDLDQYRPNRGTDNRGVSCNMHSWSNQGFWRSLCYTPDHAHATEMWNKPREITNYRYGGNGFEIAYETSGRANADEGFRVLLGAYNDIILQHGFWSKYNWPAMGVGVYGQHAVVWFGDEPDPQGSLAQCQ
jgi:hypothetical protein